MDVQFNEEPSLVRAQPRERATGAAGLAGLVIKAGFASNARDAQRVLLGIAVAAVVLGIVFHVFMTPDAQPLSDREFQENLERMRAPLPTR